MCMYLHVTAYWTLQFNYDFSLFKRSYNSRHDDIGVCDIVLQLTKMHS